MCVFRRRWRPVRPRLLTEEEYIRQGQEETRKALEELRAFCHSPQCNAWKTLSRLENPQRYVYIHFHLRVVFASDLHFDLILRPISMNCCLDC